MKKFLLLALVPFLVLTLSGCTLMPSVSNSKNIAGVFKTYDYGETWKTINEGTLDQKKVSLNTIDINRIALDPTDHKQIYAGTSSRGVWYSNDGGGLWQNILSAGTVYSLAPDPKERGILYVSLGTKVYKTLDLGKKWQSIYLETRPKIAITALAVDPAENLVVYLGTNSGEVYQTADGGESWKNITKTTGQIKKILVNPKDHNIIYLLTTNNGIYKTSDRGLTWKNLKNNYQSTKDKSKNFSGALIASDLIFDPTQKDALLYASKYGLLQTKDGGENWQPIKILTPPNSAIINSLAINPQNNKQIFYATSAAIFRSFDSGQTWLSSASPSSKSPKIIIIDPDTPNVLYLGMSTAK
ncbi:MAG TPA: hypothetical protein PKZ16_02125 [bacterium]|nr:hypothetical protein [bacterium]HPL95630.1 hypothetical protein [bacterium]